ncbi:hypothetical protein B0H11DRAFT_1902553 [Mycena galericulata]|nr:hypothetical protein B0H11DRAFT_1902553 [Mycena galericulata]
MIPNHNKTNAVKRVARASHYRVLSRPSPSEMFPGSSFRLRGLPAPAIPSHSGSHHPNSAPQINHHPGSSSARPFSDSSSAHGMYGDAYGQRDMHHGPQLPAPRPHDHHQGRDKELVAMQHSPSLPANNQISSPFSRAPDFDQNMYLQRSATFEAQVHSRNDLFQYHMNRMHDTIVNLQQEVQHLTGQNIAMKDEIAQIHARLDGGSLAVGSASKVNKKVKEITNQHPEVKNAVHAMFWRLIAIDPNADAADRHAQMTDGHDAEALFILIEGPAGTESKMWKPDFSAPVNTRKNKAFVQELLERVSETEKLNRQNGKGQLPDPSFDNSIIKSVAQTYFSSIASTWKKMRTDEGKKKLEDMGEKKKLRGRRETVTANRRSVVDEFETMYGVSGAAGLLDTDFASSLVSVDESEITDRTTQRRKELGARPGDWMYVRFLRELDRFYSIKLAATKKHGDAAPPRKKQRSNPKKSTPRFAANLDKASNRPPASKKNPPIRPIAGMVKKSWNAGQKEKVVTLEDPDWWDTWVDDAESLDSDVQELIDELPTDSDSDSDCGCCVISLLVL